MPEPQAREQALKELGPGAKLTGEALDPDADAFPEEWGGDTEFDESGKLRLKTRNSDFKAMGEVLRGVLEERWPAGPIPEDLQREINDLLQDHQYDEQGRRIGPSDDEQGEVPMSMMDLDTLLRSVYRRSNPAA